MKLTIKPMMIKPTIFMMCGLVGSGKSYYAQELAKPNNANIHSSDAIREELSGDVNNQNINELVFKTLHSRIKEDLRNGKNCIYDATNINYKKRMSFLQELKNIECKKVCIFMATPYEECLARNSARDRVVPEEVIKRMYMSFDPPAYYEGWDHILVFYSENSRGSKGSLVNWGNSMMQYSQDNSHHSLTLGEHVLSVYQTILNPIFDLPVIKYREYFSTHKEVLTAAILHDCGKPFAKTFKNTKGEITEQAHYYNHEHCGSYDAFFYDMLGEISPRDIALLVRWHMQPYFWEKDNNEKQHNKYRQLWGEELYQDIMKLHAADKKAH